MPATFFDNPEFPPAGIPLSQYTNAITNAVASARDLAGVWVIAELSDVRIAGGHCYMELIEKDASGQTRAKLRATIWKSTYLQLRQKFFSATNREISNGIKALVRGSATHHSLYGLSFNIIDIDPSYTMGDMERLRREILMKLHKEGVAGLNKNLVLPVAPQRIAVISAQGAAGYGDFINHLCNNSEGFVFYPCLFPCVMQGEKVAESILQALEFIESTADLWDCVAIVRGGGATTDLNGFDDYALARGVATCGLPVIVGIGHERDRNVLDEIAHTSLKTPTAVAGFFIDRARSAYEGVMMLAERIRHQSGEQLRGEEIRLATIKGLIPQLALQRIEDHKYRLQNLITRFPLLTEVRFGKEKSRLEGMTQILSNVAAGRCERERIKIDSIVNILQSISINKINFSAEKIKRVEALVSVLDPINTLKRGYSVTRINGKALKSGENLLTGDELVTTLAQGEIRSVVKK